MKRRTRGNGASRLASLKDFPNLIELDPYEIFIAVSLAKTRWDGRVGMGVGMGVGNGIGYMGRAQFGGADEGG